MNIASLLTSFGINTAVCVVAFTLYSILRKQPNLVNVYFGQRLAMVRAKRHDHFHIDRLVPSVSWIMKAWETSEDELYAAGGLDAVVFLRIVVFSIRILAIASTICLFLVLPLNYFGQEMQHKKIEQEELAVFTTANLKEGKWVWAHCLALYMITCCSCFLLYMEYKTITKLRLAHITDSLSNPSHFTALVRGIPSSPEESYSENVAKFFVDYYSSSYLSHQMVYPSGTVQKLAGDAERMYRILKSRSSQSYDGPSLMTCGLCGGTATSFKILPTDSEQEKGRSEFSSPGLKEQECAAAFVFFRTRYAALVASQALQSPNPMIWVTDAAPEPQDVYWANLCVPYRIFWIRRIAIIFASILFVSLFLMAVGITQGLVHVEKLREMFPSMREILERKIVSQVVTGYLPSVIYTLFSYTAPPLMFLFSKLEGSISRSGRKRSACIKVLYFMIWNGFFGNVFTGSLMERVGSINARGIPHQLGRAVPSATPFFMTYIMTSGWASLSVELLQPFGLLCFFLYKFILRKKDESASDTLTFPYHTEAARVLLFLLVGFTCCIFAPLILPFLLVYFVLAFFVYRNQLLNVYEMKYQSGGLYWPIAHNAAVFSLVLTQLIALGVFGLKESTIAMGFTVPLLVCTVLFHEYCRQRFHPVFKKNAAEVLIRMDREDEHCGRLEEIHAKLPSAYCQFTPGSVSLGQPIPLDLCESGKIIKHEDLEVKTTGRRSPLPPSENQKLYADGPYPNFPMETEDFNSGKRSAMLPHQEIYELHEGRRSLKLPQEIEEMHAGWRSPMLACEIDEMYANRRSPKLALKFEKQYGGSKSAKFPHLEINELQAGRRSPV